MPREDSTYPHDWAHIAERDLARAERLLAMEDPEAAAFFLQQSIEKFLKAFLLSQGWRLKRVHDLEVLLNDALAFEPSLEEFRGLCQEATGFYMIERYPFTGFVGVTDEDISRALDEGKRLIERLKSRIR